MSVNRTCFYSECEIAHCEELFEVNAMCCDMDKGPVRPHTALLIKPSWSARVEPS